MKGGFIYFFDTFKSFKQLAFGKLQITFVETDISKFLGDDSISGSERCLILSSFVTL